MRLYVTPDNWLSRLSSIPDDGRDYDIVFDPGDYVLPFTTITILLDHRAGGRITFHSLNDPYPRIISPALAFTNVYIVAHDFVMDRIHLVSNFPELVAGEQPDIFNFFVGNRTDTESNIFPTASIAITRSIVEGVTRLLMTASAYPEIYTDILIEDVALRNIGKNMALQIGAVSTGPNVQPVLEGTGGRYNALISNITHTGKNGPDSTAYGGVPTSTHSDGVGGLDISTMDGHSTVTVTNWQSDIEITGALNHDLHCMRANAIISKDVRIVVRDARLNGVWSEGHIGAPTHLLHLFYYHAGGPTFTGNGARPRFDFENVQFATRITNNASTDEIATARLDLIWPTSSADYHFWDCTFAWDVPAAWNTPQICAVRVFVEREISLNFHRCTFDFPSFGEPVVYNSGGPASETIVFDDETRAYREDAWFRKTPVHHFPPRPQDVEAPTNLVANPSFETTSVWNLYTNASYTTDKAFEGTRSLKLRSIIAGAPPGTNGIADIAMNLLPGTTYRVFLRANADDALDDPLPDYRTSLLVQVDPGNGIFTTLAIKAPGDLLAGWDFIDAGTFVAIGTAGLFRVRVSTAGTSFSIVAGNWFVDLVQVYNNLLV